MKIPIIISAVVNVTCDRRDAGIEDEEDDVEKEDEKDEVEVEGDEVEGAIDDREDWASQLSALKR